MISFKCDLLRTRIIITTHTLILLVTGKEGDMSCSGGLMDNAFKYIIKNGGIDTEESYPYKAHVSGVVCVDLNLEWVQRSPHSPSWLPLLYLNSINGFIRAQDEKRCRYKKADSGATMSSYRDIKKESESDLQAAVGTVGPISVAIDASHSSFQVSKWKWWACS